MTKSIKDKRTITVPTTTIEPDFSVNVTTGWLLSVSKRLRAARTQADQQNRRANRLDNLLTLALHELGNERQVKDVPHFIRSWLDEHNHRVDIA